MSSLEEVFPHFLKIKKQKEEIRNIILNEREMKRNLYNIANTPHTYNIPNTPDTKEVIFEDECTSTANHFFKCKECRKRIMYYNSVLESLIYVLSIIIIILALAIINKN